MTINEETRAKRDKMMQIFRPWGDWADFGYVIDLLDMGLLSYTSEIAEIEIPEKYNIERGPGSKETLLHLRTKYTATKMLKDLGEEHPLVEYELWDVYSPKLKIRVECGHTDPARLIHSFHLDNVNEFWVLQYPKITALSPEIPPMLYKFTLSEEGKDFLNRFFNYGESTKKMADRIE